MGDMEKRRPHYPLVDIKAALADPKTLNRTMTATKGAAALGLDAVVALVQALTPRDFDKSMTSHVSSRVWQDALHQIHQGPRQSVSAHQFQGGLSHGPATQDGQSKELSR